MATDPKRIKPAELVRVLNSTPLGPVVDDRTIYAHRQLAGYAIGDGRTIHLVKYARWLAARAIEQLDRDDQPFVSDDGYEALKNRAAARSASLSRSGREIGELPAVVDPDRKAAAARDFRRFAEAYFPETFGLPWCEDHLKVIAKIETAVLEGGLFALAMPRGSGKTTLCEIATIWALLYGHTQFGCLIGTDESHAEEMLASIKIELEQNERLADDFPEACHPIRALEGIANRCNGQLYQGQRTRITWTTKEIVLPTIAAAASSGNILKVAGLTGRIRGMKHKRPDGTSVRPRLVIVDDPQTNATAHSQTQCRTREDLLAGAVLGLAGPGEKISGIMPCTVIYPNDMADAILDRERHPEWNGERMKMVYHFPTNEKLWGDYAELRRDGLRDGDAGRAATEFYRQHRQQMEEGAVVAWPERFNHDELSALQHAMNLKIDKERAFWAEYQNEPMDDEILGTIRLDRDALLQRTNNLDRGTLPLATEHLTAFIDVQQLCLYYLVTAWSTDFSGAVVDYGTFPKQALRYYTAHNVQQTLQARYPGTGFEGCLEKGLTELVELLTGREWRREDHATVPIGRILIDANWGKSTEIVKRFCRRSPHARLLLPAHGRFFGASRTPLHELPIKPGERRGHRWRMPPLRPGDATRYVTADINFWKSFVAQRLSTDPGDPGAITFFGRRGDQHRLLVDHLTSEKATEVTANERTVEEWQLIPDRENHWWDCLVGAAVAASVSGVQIAAAQGQPRARKRQKLSELRAQKRRENMNK